MTNGDTAVSPIQWAQDAADAGRVSTCRACGVNDTQFHVLSVADPNRRDANLSLHRCQHCESLNFTDFEPRPEIPWEQLNGMEREHLHACAKFYVEQAAGIDALLDMISSLPPPPRGQESARRFVDVGCGYGFTLDFVRSTFGWDAAGVDPSPLARLGSEHLGVNIIQDYIAPGFQLPGGPCDLLFCAEVIEHISKPEPFLANASALLKDDGCLLLTTPNAAGCTPQQDIPALLPLLSPGSHTLLFSRRALENLLRRVGFTHIQMQAKKTTLKVLASRRPQPRVNLDSTISQKLYRRYLRDRSQAVPDDEPLQHGLLYRLFKELANAGLYEEGLSVFAEISDSYQRRYGIDLASANSAMQHLAAVSTGLKGLDEELRVQHFTNFMQAVPINLCGILYFRGMATLNHDDDKIRAYNYFHNAELVGRSLQNFFIHHHMSDGEIESLIPLSRAHADLSKKRFAALPWLQIMRQRVRNFLRKN